MTDIVWLASVRYNDYEEDLLGVFSTADNAKAACQIRADGIEESPLVWVSVDDHLYKAQGTYDYAAYSVIIDERW